VLETEPALKRNLWSKIGRTAVDPVRFTRYYVACIKRRMISTRYLTLRNIQLTVNTVNLFLSTEAHRTALISCFSVRHWLIVLEESPRPCPQGPIFKSLSSDHFLVFVLKTYVSDDIPAFKSLTTSLLAYAARSQIQV